MLKSIILLFFLSLLAKQQSFSQDATRGFFTEADGTIGNRTHVHSIGFRTINLTAPFFDALQKKYGKPKQEDMFRVFNGYNSEWTDYKIIIRVSSLREVGQDKREENTVFIFVETSGKIDLLDPKAAVRKKIVADFLKMYDETVKNGKPEKF